MFVQSVARNAAVFPGAGMAALPGPLPAKSVVVSCTRRQERTHHVIAFVYVFHKQKCQILETSWQKDGTYCF